MATAVSTVEALVSHPTGKGHLVNPAERKQFVSSYTKLLTTAWTNDDFIERLRSDPKSVLGEFNLEVPAGASVDIRSESEGEPNLDRAVSIWEEGQSSGVFRLYVPNEPQYESSELSESDLEAVVGGGTSACCCCSSPCCCCT